VSAGKILVIDDEPHIRRLMRLALTAQGYEVVDARSGEEGLRRFGESMPDLVVLDLNMPGMGGLETCRMIRSGSEAPIIVLTVRSAETDKVEALDAGADDYVTKPFGTKELLARIRAALRRAPGSIGEPRVFVTKDLDVNFEARRVRAKGQEIRLTPKEFELLRYLVAHAGKPVRHRELLQAVWGPDYGDETSYLRVFVTHLRKKIEPDPTHPRYILTEPWIGYRFEAGHTP
jgi:two-component system KDP operon response regulator KdpE